MSMSYSYRAAAYLRVAFRYADAVTIDVGIAVHGPSPLRSS